MQNNFLVITVTFIEMRNCELLKQLWHLLEYLQEVIEVKVKIKQSENYATLLMTLNFLTVST